MNTTRSRWAAIGAAVAVTLGAGGIGISQATTDSGDGPVSAFFPIEPCRLAANASITEDSSITLDGWGTSGDCDLPADITGLAANVTAVDATAQTNIRFYAQGDDVPETANLNPSPGAAPTPNAVNITINDTNGQFSVYNRFGSVGIFIDVMGYYDDHTHDDRYYTQSQVDQIVAEATEPAPWRIDLSPGDITPFFPSSDFPAILRGTGVPRSVEGALFPNGTTTTGWLSWTLPPTYTRASPVDVTVQWLPENNFGPDPTACNYVVTGSSFTATKSPDLPLTAEATWQSGAATTDPFAAAHPLGPAGTYPVQTLTFTIDGDELEPGHNLLGTIGRLGSDGSDTCSGDLYVTGITIQEGTS